MNYATTADMLQRFGEQELLQLTDAGRSGEIDETLLDLALIDATAEIDSYLATVRTTAPTTTFGILISVACDIARYRLYAGIGGQTDQVKERYDAAVRWLRDVAMGRAKLGIASDTVPTTSSIAATERTFIFDSAKQTAYTNIFSQTPYN